MLTKEQRQYIIDTYQSNDISIVKLKRLTGYSEPTISKVLKEAGIIIRKKNYQKLPISEQEVNHLYHQEKWSTYKIAKHFKCSDETIRIMLDNVRPIEERNKLEPESIEKIRATSNKLWHDPAYVEKVKAGTSTDEYRQKLSLAGKNNYTLSLGKWITDASSRATISSKVKELWASDSYRKKQSVWFQSRSQNLIDGFRKLLDDPVRKAAWVESMRRTATNRQATSGWISTAQKQLCYILSVSGITYHEEGENTKIGPFYVVDCVIPKQQNMIKPLIIEVQGEYWHSLQHVMVKDRQKATYVKNHTDYDLLALEELEMASFDQVTGKLKDYGLTVHADICKAKDLEIRQISESDASTFYSIFHYSGTVRKGAITFGAFLGSDLVACISYTYPLRMETVTKLGFSLSEVMEISRLSRRTNVVCKNLASFLVGATRKLLPDSVKCIVSFSDATYGHSGGVYKACGFTQHGIVEPDYFYASLLGRFHKKTIWDRSKRMKMNEVDYAEKHGLVKIYGRQKIRWVYVK